MIKESIEKDLKAAMLTGDKRLVSILRSIKSAILYKEVAEGKRDTGLDETSIISVLKKEQKSREDAVDLYEKANEVERADEEQYQINVIKKYLPEEVAESRIKQLVDEAINTLDIGTPNSKDLGAIIGYVKKAEPNAEGSIIARVVNIIINS
ncbi:GatB/YqeY domain-containing protein [Candidatus Saccharibacteria bacterium]|nr:GatB/YqeY domain-containing protein [Candidatus Saccharibacteria bacterium]